MEHLLNAYNEMDEHKKAYISTNEQMHSVTFIIQHEPIKMVGVNGVQASDLLEFTRNLFESLNSAFPCEENLATINSLNDAMAAQEARTARREAAGIEGTNQEQETEQEIEGITKARKRPIEVRMISFENFVTYGKNQKGVNIVGGMPWSFNFMGYPVTHERDDLYLIPTPEGVMRFTPDDVLMIGVKGEIYPYKKDIFNSTYDLV